MKLVFLFLVGLALGAVAPAGGHAVRLQRGNCPLSWFSFNNRCYKYIATPMTWADAERHCRSSRANLVSIHSLKERKFVSALVKFSKPKESLTWIGLTDVLKEGKWMWSDSSAVDYTFWGGNQPDNYLGHEHCAHVFPDSKWNDERCALTLPFVCASSTVCF